MVHPQLGPVSDRHGPERRGKGRAEGRRLRKKTHRKGVQRMQTEGKWCVRCASTPAVTSRSLPQALVALGERCSVLWSGCRAAASAGEPRLERGYAPHEPLQQDTVHMN